MEKIRIDNLSFKYPLSEKAALKNISLEIAPSEFVVICGKSGCGKSTLLRQLKKSLVPYGEKEGRVEIDGVLVEEQDDRVASSQVGFVQQNPDNQIVTDKVWHELAFGLENLGYSNPIIKRRVAEMASYFGINTWFRKDTSELSGGQKQLLNLAAVMAMQPEILVLDEPASQLDPISATDFLNTVYKINRDLGVTVVISEHRLEDVFPMADKVIVLDDGQLLTQGDPKSVCLNLSKASHGEPHSMFFGMPQVMRIFEKDPPLTVREGRLLLDEMLSERDAETLRNINLDKEPRTTTSEEKILELKDLYFRYKREDQDILRGLNLSVEKGSINCLLGGNGSGKTTLLKAVMGLVKPQRGKVWISDEERLAMVPQNPQALFTEITVEEEILEGMAYLEMTMDERIKRTEEMLKLMEIEHLRQANPYDLSGGEMQRLAIAKVMALDPTLLLLDEPTKGLDPFFKRTLGNILLEMSEKGKTIFMVSHDIDFCAAYGDRCFMFFDGEISAEGESHEFFSGNNFYTTTANKLTRKYRDDLILAEEVKAWLTKL